MVARKDYAKKSAPRNAPRNPQRRKAGARKPVAGWVWLLVGLSIGLFIAFLVTISEQETKQQPVAAIQKKKIVKSGGRPDPKKSTESRKRKGVKFDFYHILPEMEVAIPKEEIKTGRKSNTPLSQYVIQVGSFKNAADAESRRAELFLLNFEPSVQTVTIDGSQSWHRVRLGPFVDRRKLDLAQRQLQNSDIDFITLKERK